MARTGYNFRGLSTYVTDGAGETGVAEDGVDVAKVYSGSGYGYVSLTGLNTRSRSAAIDRRIAGCHYPGSGTIEWKVDLPDGPGTYNVWLLLGDNASGWNHQCVIKDGATTLTTITGTTATARWLDGAGTNNRTAANIAAGTFDSIELTFAGSTAHFELGGAAGSPNSFIAHVAFEIVPGGTDPTLSAGSFTADSPTTGDLSVTADVAAGTIYAVLTTSATTPTEVQIAAGQDHTGAAAAWDGSDATPTVGANPFSASGLTAATEYWPHFFHDTGAGDVLTGTSDTTDAANAAPVWSGTPTAMGSKRGQALTPQDVSGLVSDGDLDTLAFSITGAPAGVSINGSTGIISGTQTAAPGVYACTVEADDGVNPPVSSGNFNITVTQCVLALNATPYEVLSGAAPATAVGQAGQTFDVAAYPLAQWPPTAPVASASSVLDADHLPADLGDDDLTFGTTYRLIARINATGEPFTWLMTAS